MKILRVTTVPISLNVLLKGQFKYMKDQGFEVIVASADGKEVREIMEREGVKHFVLPFTRSINPFIDLYALVKTVILILNEKPDIVHTHTPKAGLIGMMAAWLCRVKYRLHTVAGMPLMEATGITKLILSVTEMVTYKAATAIFPNSFQLQDWIINKLKVSRYKLKVIGNGSSNGINSEFYRPSNDLSDQAEQLKKELKIPRKNIVLIFVGRLVRDKGINELVNAFQKICQYRQDIDLLLVGDFEDIREPLTIITKRNITQNPNIHFVGFQEDIRPFLMASDIFVFPSYREGFPNVLMQAACFNLPLIATDINGCNEIIKNGYNGILIETKNENQLEKAMIQLIENNARRNNMGKTNREMIIKKYDQQYIWEELRNEYLNLVK